MSNDEKKNVMPFKPKEKEEDIRANMSIEEIKEFMRREEEELLSKADKFLALNPKPDIDEIEEEDEDEEVFTLDLEKGIVTEKIGEGVAMRDGDGAIHMVDDEELTAKVMEMVAEEKKPELQIRYQDMILDRFVSRAISSLIEKLNDAAGKASDVGEDIGGDIGYGLGDKLFETVRKQKEELRFAIAGGKVHYDKIPDWSRSYIDEYITNALNELLLMTERG